MTPTPEGKQLAADLANAVRREMGYPEVWTADRFSLDCLGTIELALARLATEHLALKTKHEEALADLREIDRIAAPVVWTDKVQHLNDIATIAAKYRVETDPLIEALMSIVPDIDCDAGESPAEAVARQLRATLKRGYEIGGKSPQPNARVSVPDGQTPLNDKLGHRLLDVVKEGQAARDNGTVSPYHGHSLEHCLHAIGWVQRDLRIALDEMKGRDK